jgi:hypothetical protein
MNQVEMWSGESPGWTNAATASASPMSWVAAPNITAFPTSHRGMSEKAGLQVSMQRHARVSSARSLSAPQDLAFSLDRGGADNFRVVAIGPETAFQAHFRCPSRKLCLAAMLTSNRRSLDFAALGMTVLGGWVTRAGFD